MKQLLIMRHAKSDWSTGAMSDFDRPLNDRGLRNAPLMAGELKKRNILPDLVISSPALRAKTTAKLVAENLNYLSEIKYVDEFYLTNVKTILKHIHAVPESVNTLLIVGHNPTWEDLANYLSYNKLNLEMATAAIVSFRINIKNWNEIDPVNTIFNWIIKPKMFE